MSATGREATVERRVRVANKAGLHARPSSVLAEGALRFPLTRILVRKGEFEVDAKSIMELLLLEASCGTELTVVAAGPKAEEALHELEKLFEREFDLHL